MASGGQSRRASFAAPNPVPSCSFWRMAADSDAIWHALDEQRRDLKLPDLSINKEQFRRAIELLPAADVEWAISEDATTVWALSAATLFKVRVEGNSATLTSRPVDPSALTVCVRWTENAEAPIAHWTFGHRDGEEYLQIAGRTKTIMPVEGSERADRREVFARALASRGWGTADS